MARPKPNLLFVFADQLRACSVGYAGEEPVRTPHIDAFAAAGTSHRLWQAHDVLLGPGRYHRREGVGGTIPVRFPSEVCTSTLP